MVLVMVSLLLVLLTAMLTLSRSETRSSDAYVSTIRTNHLADIAKSAVIAQIRRGTQFDPSEGIAWASQPGAIRAYSANGNFYRGFKLYSDSQMEVHQDEDELAADSPHANWDQKPNHYVDLNEPVVRMRGDGELHTYFPIIDPRAFYDDTETDEDERVEGFSYREDLGNGEQLAGVVGGGNDPDNWRVPMPVEWLYVLRDGTVGILDAENSFQPKDKVSGRNPIVGRVAFWTDDESCKININTASEPTYWATPTLGDRDDWGWAKIQPGSGEFQRFPGHPATTALSPVLFPNQRFADPPTPDEKGKMDAEMLKAARDSAAEKGKIYGWAPKIQDVGSRAGTAFLRYSQKKTKRGMKRNFWYEKEYDPKESAKEHLYASVDEFLFDGNRQEKTFEFTTFEDASTGGRRISQSAGKFGWENEETIRRSRAFLTAHSRSPETTLFGTPRIAMWPLHDNADPAAGYRTHFDQLIARCATLGSVDAAGSTPDNSYYFRRIDSESSTTDLEIERNQKLLEYLRELTSRPVPGFGESFESKYMDDRDQILIQMFDYIRATNLFDPYLASQGREEEGEYKTYTAGRKTSTYKGEVIVDVRDGATHFVNGHGHVVPSYSEDWDAKGLGRTVTLDEVSMLFICCADGTPNQHNKYRRNPNIQNPWKGGAAAKIKGSKKNENDTTGWARSRTESVAYSNFPPNPQGEPYGPKKDADGNEIKPPHPGYLEKNWNYCLEDNEPLEPDHKRIQGMLLMDYFNPAPGYNPVMGRYGLRVKGLKNLKLNGQSIFPEDEAEIWRTGGSPNAHWTVGHGLKGKLVESRDPMPDDEHTNLDLGKPGQKNEMITNFIEVSGDTMTFGANEPIEVEVVSQQVAGGPSEVLQTIFVKFPEPHAIPTPNLVLEGKPGDKQRPNPDRGEGPPDDWDPATDGEYVRYRNFHPQPTYFWSFYRSGYNRNEVRRNVYSPGGRMRDPSGRKGRNGRPEPGDFVFPHPKRDVIYSLIPWHGDYRITAASSVVEKDPNSPYDEWIFAPIEKSPTAEDPSAMRFGRHSLEHSFQRGLNVRNNALSYRMKRLYDGRKKNRVLYTANELGGVPWPTGGYGPHFPGTEAAVEVSSRYGDFDIGFGKVQGGAFINKPDEGNLHKAAQGTDNSGELGTEEGDAGRFLQIPYFHTFGASQETQDGFFSPNRMISSPVMMGSLPSGVKAQDPWRTLLFRPDVNSIDKDGNATIHPGAKSPPDHLFLDLFWMPVVQPYAISEPFSTAGKINLNYQMLPFTHIRRATGMHGLLKDERIPSMPVAEDPPRDHNYGRILAWNAERKYDESHDISKWRGKYLYRSVDVDETLEDFDRKFEEDSTLFRSASQICEMFLVPEVLEMPEGVEFSEGKFSDTEADIEDRMKDYWKTHRGTSDNLRERPYGNIYSRVTTQTNTWRIHYRVQRLKKSPQSEKSTFDSKIDTVAGEQRGSMLLERYIDPNDPLLPDFTEDPTETLDSRYQFRILSTRRFSM